MADRSFPSQRIMNFQRDGVLLCGKFSVTAGVGILANSRFGDGWTVAYTAAGRFTITTNDPYRHVIACGAFFNPTTVTDRFMVGTPPGGGAGAVVTWEIDLWDVSGAAVTDPAAATDEIHFWMLLSNNGNDRAAW